MTNYPVDGAIFLAKVHPYLDANKTQDSEVKGLNVSYFLKQGTVIVNPIKSRVRGRVAINIGIDKKDSELVSKIKELILE